MAWVMQILAWAVKQYSHVLLFAFVKHQANLVNCSPLQILLFPSAAYVTLLSTVIQYSRLNLRDMNTSVASMS